ncbi:hypothetical protein PR003_g28930 [Phytophthora rubi]|uniref:Secreted protein n=1 Tax=Phytophthora rubi TaxID=129364 RepID=A0A6A3HKT9_9STRA|nr:hypothetical protein PR001_g27633 [Phytophthora rubi]KAE9276915.1 hypothetical protein PR003_g28930 [Phytophthora rubi]
MALLAAPLAAIFRVATTEHSSSMSRRHRQLTGCVRCPDTETGGHPRTPPSSVCCTACPACWQCQLGTARHGRTLRRLAQTPAASVRQCRCLFRR